MTHNATESLIISSGRVLKSEIRMVLILAGMLLCCLLSVTKFGEATDAMPRIAVGISTEAYFDIDIRDADVATRLWAKEIGDQTGFRPETHLYSDVQGLMDDFQKGKLDMATFSTLTYFRHESSLHGDPAFVTIKHGKALQRYVVLIPSSRSDVNIKSLKGLILALTQNDDMSILFLNTLLLRQRQPEMNGFFSSVLTKPKPSQTINAVFFGSADICVTTEQAFQTMTELNPQVGRKLKIVSISPGLLQGVSLYRSDYPKATRNKIEAVVFNLKKYPRGKQVLTLFQGDDLAILNIKDFTDTRQLYLEYRRLKGKLL